MDAEKVARELVILFLVLCTLETTLFPLFFGLRSRWRSTSIGRATLYMWAGMAAVLWLGMTRLVFEVPDEIRVWLGVVIYGSLSVLFGWKFWILLKIQRDPEKVAREDLERELAREQKEESKR